MRARESMKVGVMEMVGEWAKGKATVRARGMGMDSAKATEGEPRQQQYRSNK